MEPIISAFSVTDTSISGEITPCVDSDQLPSGVCDLTILLLLDDKTHLATVPVTAPDWTLTGLTPGTTYALVANASDGDGVSYTGPYGVVTAGDPPVPPPSDAHPGEIRQPAIPHPTPRVTQRLASFTHRPGSRSSKTP